MCSIERYVWATRDTGSAAKWRCIARFASALSSAAMIIDWSSTRMRCPIAPVVGLTASKKPFAP